MNLESLNPLSDDIQDPDNSDPAQANITPSPDHQNEWLALAQHRNLEALTSLIDQRLTDLTVKVVEIEFKQDLLQLSVASSEVPEQTVIVPLLRDYLSQLRLPEVTSATIYGHKFGQELPFWMEDITLDLLMLDSQALTPGIPIGGNEDGTGDVTTPLPEVAPLPSEIALDIAAKYAAGERDFTRINLKDEALSGINLTLADLQEANLVWCDLKKSSLSHANLTSAQLRHADLTEANLQGAKLQGTDLQGAKLQGANLSWAILRGTNLTDADLTDVNFQHATLERVIMPDGTILD